MEINMKKLSLGEETLVLDVEHCQDTTCELHHYLLGSTIIFFRGVGSTNWRRNVL